MPFRTGTGIIKPLAEGEQRCGFGRDPWESASVAASDLLWLLWQGEQTNSTGVKISWGAVIAVRDHVAAGLISREELFPPHTHSRCVI